MTKSCTTAPQVRPRQSLSARLWLLATLAVLLSEIVVFLPYIAHERSDWLTDRVEDASLVLLAASGGPLDAAKRDELLRLAGVVAIHFSQPGVTDLTVGDVGAATAAVFDLRQTNLFECPKGSSRRRLSEVETAIQKGMMRPNSFAKDARTGMCTSSGCLLRVG